MASLTYIAIAVEEAGRGTFFLLGLGVPIAIFIIRDVVPLKYVWLEDDTIVVSNFIKSARIPVGRISVIYPATISGIYVIEFKEVTDYQGRVCLEPRAGLKLDFHLKEHEESNEVGRTGAPSQPE